MPGVAVVTGAGRGIGRAIAAGLARDDWAVGLLDVQGESATASAAELVAGGARAVGLAADVTDRPSLRAAVEAVEAELGPVEALVNNAGWDTLARFVEGPPELWDRVIAINLKGVLNATHAVLEGMIARGRGRIDRKSVV